VHHEGYTKLKAGQYLHSIEPGVDLRDHGVGAFKNTIAGPVAFVFTPLRALEAVYWNCCNHNDGRCVTSPAKTATMEA